MKKLFNLIDDPDSDLINFKFTDILGQWHDITYHASAVDENEILHGIMFDGSSLPGWRGIEQSDMILIPDMNTAWVDVYAEIRTINVICSVKDPNTNTLYTRDPRSTAIRAENNVLKSGIADKTCFGPEPEFFIFDEVEFSTHTENSFFRIATDESPNNASAKGNELKFGHHPIKKKAYCAAAPKDVDANLRGQMLLALQECGINVEKHHHEVARAQHELGIKYASLVRSADEVCMYKQIVKEVAHAHGKTATFMPKPFSDDNGSGMHVHQSLQKNGKNLFAGDCYAGLSEMALYYIGGLLKHAKALNAFTNPTMNSYRRLTPGFEAPTVAVYSACNRSAACRIPFANAPQAKRIEARFPDPSANPYLAFAAMLMAGLDGIAKKIHPGEHWEKNLYALSPEERVQVPRLATSLEEALVNLETDHEFLMVDNVFTDEQIQSYIALKRQEIEDFQKFVTPADFKFYYSV